MRENFVKLACKISKGKNLLDVYGRIAEFFKKSKCFVEYDVVLNAILKMSQDIELYKVLSENAEKNICDKEKSFEYLSRYYKCKNENEYYKFIILAQQSGSNILPVNDDEWEKYKEFPELIKYTTSHSVIFSMILHECENNNDIEIVKELADYLIQISENLKKYAIEHHKELENERFRIDEITQYKEDEALLSDKLTKYKHHDDINKLAIVFNPYNKQAYLNVLGNAIENKDKTSAMNLYNELYTIVFRKEKVDNISDLCLKLSDYYRSKSDFYKAVYYQKKALELELGED